MMEKDIETITTDGLLEKVQAKRTQECRLVQISATRLPNQVEITYSFDRDKVLSNLRLSIPAESSRLPSISSVYGCAVLYENEIHDLFDVQVDGLTVNFQGNFYKTRVKFPFGSTKAPCPSAAAAPAAQAQMPAVQAPA